MPRVQVTVPDELEHDQPGASAETKLVPAGSGSVTVIGCVFERVAVAFVTARRYVPFEPARNSPAGTDLFSAMSVDWTTLIRRVRVSMSPSASRAWSRMVR